MTMHLFTIAQSNTVAYSVINAQRVTPSRSPRGSIISLLWSTQRSRRTRANALWLRHGVTEEKKKVEKSVSVPAVAGILSLNKLICLIFLQRQSTKSLNFISMVFSQTVPEGFSLWIELKLRERGSFETSSSTVPYTCSVELLSRFSLIPYCIFCASSVCFGHGFYHRY